MDENKLLQGHENREGGSVVSKGHNTLVLRETPSSLSLLVSGTRTISFPLWCCSEMFLSVVSVVY
jgi:hypothetical protein